MFVLKQQNLLLSQNNELRRALATQPKVGVYQSCLFALNLFHDRCAFARAHS
jgi:hypothetical protein